MFTLPLSLLLFAQAGAAPIVQAGPPLTSAQARLEVCLDTARTDPATAISEASQWLSEESRPHTSPPQQCLGTAYMSLLRWQAAHMAFTFARDDRPSIDHAARARLGAMAGNAALANEQYEDALSDFEIAQGEAAAALLNQTAGEIAADRARALVALDRGQAARSALSYAREMAPQSATIWLLSATLERRLDELEAAQSYIASAAALFSDDDENEAELEAEIMLEAGLIAAMTGRDDAARGYWQGLEVKYPDSPFAERAGSYLSQLNQMKAEELSASGPRSSQP